MDAPKKSHPTLQASAMQHTAEFSRSHYHVVVDDNVQVEDILRPAFWAHHVSKLKPGAVIDVVRADLTLDVTLRVTDVGVGYASVRPLRVWEDEAVVRERREAKGAATDGGGPIEAIPDEYKITAVGRGGFSVRFVPSDAQIASGVKTRAAAVALAREHAEKAGIAWPDAPPVPETAGA